MQILYWLLLPKLLREEKPEDVMILAQFIFLFQFLPKLYHCFHLMHGVSKVAGYLFGTAWWGFILNLIVYFLASHVRIHSIHTLFHLCNNSERYSIYSFLDIKIWIFQILNPTFLPDFFIK